METRLVKTIRRKESLFTASVMVNVGIFTWNSFLDKSQINETIPDEFFSKVDELLDMDVLAVGLQDIFKITTSNFLSLDSEELCKRWEEVLLNYMKMKQPSYQKIQSVFYGGNFFL